MQSDRVRRAAGLTAALPLLLAPLLLLAPRCRADDAQVCYDQLGCFSDAFPWSYLARPVPPPASPAEVGTRFFFVKNATAQLQELRTWPNISFSGVEFNSSLQTIYITHGFGSEVLSHWPEKMARIAASKGIYNVFAVDWSKGAATPNYLAATSNTRTAGAEIGRVINYTISHLSAKRTDIHLIGHSLGAHVCSYASRAAGGVFHIVGLDSAQPLFEGFSEIVHLKKGDACLVEGIHTDGRPIIPFGGLGFIAPYADNDYYINGGYFQPACTYSNLLPENVTFLQVVESLSTFIDVLDCPHTMAPIYYSEIIANDSCIIWGHRDNSFLNFEPDYTKGVMVLSPRGINNCRLKSCSPISMNGTDYPARGIFLSRTSSHPPFCVPEHISDQRMAYMMSTHNQKENRTEICAASGIKVE